MNLHEIKTNFFTQCTFHSLKWICSQGSQIRVNARLVTSLKHNETLTDVIEWWLGISRNSFLLRFKNCFTRFKTTKGQDLNLSVLPGMSGVFKLNNLIMINIDIVESNTPIVCFDITYFFSFLCNWCLSSVILQKIRRNQWKISSNTIR